MLRLVRLMLPVLLLSLLAGCGVKTGGQEELSPEATVKAYFKAIGHGEMEEVAKLSSSRRREGIAKAGPSRIKELKVIKVEERKSELQGLEKHRERIGAADIRVVRAEFEVSFKEGHTMANGRHCLDYLLIREKEKGPWVVDDWARCR